MGGSDSPFGRYFKLIGTFVRNKRGQLALFFLAVVILGFAGYLLLRKPKTDVEEDIIEPDAELSDSITIDEFELSPKDNSKYHDSESEVLGLDFSPDGKYLLVLTGDNSHEELSQSAVIPQVRADNPGAYTLSLTDRDGKISKTVEKDKVIDARFCSNSQIYYQTVGTNAGVYLYSIESDQKEVITYTYDTSTFKNISVVDDQRYFFIQPQTGKVGFGKIGSTEMAVIGEKLANSASNYSESSAYKFSSISPNKSLIAFYDLTTDESGFVTLYIITPETTSLNEPYYTTKVFFPSRSLQDFEKVFQWSSDSRYLLAGSALILDAMEKLVVVEGEEHQFTTMTLPQSSGIFAEFSYDGNKGYIRDFDSDEKLMTLPKNISHFGWLTDKLLMTFIGKRFYVYNTEKDKLEAATEDRHQYHIITIDYENQTAWVKADNDVLVATPAAD